LLYALGCLGGGLSSPLETFFDVLRVVVVAMIVVVGVVSVIMKMAVIVTVIMVVSVAGGCGDGIVYSSVRCLASKSIVLLG